MIRKESVIAIIGSPVAYYTAFARVLGGVEAGILASQFFYWYGKGHNPEGWIYKTQAEIEEETGLSRRNQETARKKLRELGVLEESYAGMPAKLYYRLNLDQLFWLMDVWFSEKTEQEDGYVDEILEEKHALSQDGGFRHPRMYESAIQGCTNPPSKDVRIRHPRMREPAIHESANPPSMNGGMRHAFTKNTTEITTKTTTETTTPTDTTARHLVANAAVPVGVGVNVDVGDADPPSWIVEEFQNLLGSKRTIAVADHTALVQLGAYPDHIIEQALDAARDWLSKPKRKPIHSLGRWLVGTAERKLEAEQVRGSTISFLSDDGKYNLDGGLGFAIEEPDPPDSIPESEPVTPQEKIWSTLLQELALQLPKATYDAWLRDTVLVAATDDEFVIGLPNAQAKEWLENRLARTVSRTLASLLGHAIAVRFQVL